MGPAAAGPVEHSENPPVAFAWMCHWHFATVQGVLVIPSELLGGGRGCVMVLQIDCCHAHPCIWLAAYNRLCDLPACTGGEGSGLGCGAGACALCTCCVRLFAVNSLWRCTMLCVFAGNCKSSNLCEKQKYTYNMSKNMLYSFLLGCCSTKFDRPPA